MKKLFVSLFFIFSLVAEHQHTEHRAFYDWYRACTNLPRYSPKQCPYATAITAEQLRSEINRFFAIMTTQLTSCNWFGPKPSHRFYSLSRDIFEPYVQKIILPVGSIVAVHGDLHGDVHTLNRFIESCMTDGFIDLEFKIKDPRFYMIFLGDYVDRGWYGAEVLYMVLKLKNKNPDRVFMVRGNHEEAAVNNNYGFSYELQQKFLDEALISQVFRVYNFLPLAVYLGVGNSEYYDVIQCCHGGIEFGFNPRSFLEDTATDCMKIGPLMREDGYALLQQCGIKGFKKYFKNGTVITETNGFMWNDFIVDPAIPFALSKRDGFKGSILEFGQVATDCLLDHWSTNRATVRSIFRAHQHSNDMKSPMNQRIYNYDKKGHPSDAGAGKKWIFGKFHKENAGSLREISVVTFAAPPEAGYRVPYHSFGMLYTHEKFEKWYLKVMKFLPITEDKN